MTRDEVMAMTDEELRIKAAELMGWEYYCRASDITGHDDRGLCGNPPGGWTDANGEREDCLYELPDYPNDIAAAWELWEFLKRANPSDRCGFAWFFYRLVDDTPCGDIWADQPLGSLEDVFFKYLSPRAITRAFILAMEAE